MVTVRRFPSESNPMRLPFFSPHALLPTALLAATLFVVTCPASLARAGSEKEPLESKIDRLIAQLGDEDFFVREEAQKQLAQYTFEAFDALREASMHEDLEIATRAKYLLGQMQVAWASKGDPPEVEALLRDYETQDLKTKVSRMQSLAELPDDMGIPVLCRFIRFEKSVEMSKHAALVLLEVLSREGAPDKRLTATLLGQLQNSQRPSAIWVLTWLTLADKPDALADKFDQFSQNEYRQLPRATGTTSSTIASKLVRLQFEWFSELPQPEKAQAALQRLLALEPGSTETLLDLVDWLLDHQQWKAVEDLNNRFLGRFRATPVLTYSLAKARQELNNPQGAEEAVKQALQSSSGNHPTNLKRHLATARELQRHGWFDWAESEYHQIVSNGGKETLEALAALRELAEMQHDQLDDAKAAAALDELLSIERLRHITALASRREYFLACHQKSLGNAAKYREHLDKALEAEATDVDVLIACYHLPDQTEPYRDKVRTLIQTVAAELQEFVADDPDNPTGHNQFAWLVGNTEGDLDQALQSSQKSVQLSPDSGAYYDTLAHVYFTKGDYKKAVKTQQMAARLEPHSGLIRQALERFTKRLEEVEKAQREETASCDDLLAPMADAPPADTPKDDAAKKKPLLPPTP